MKPLLFAILPLPFIAGCGCFQVRDDVEDYETELTEWRDQYGDCGGPGNYIAGECSDGGILFLHATGIDTTSTDYFDAETGQYLRTGYTGFFLPFGPCFANSSITCPDGVVTEVICGDNWQVGGPFRKAR